MYTDVMYRSCKVDIARKELKVDLILLNTRDFDVILGMDCLAAHHAYVDCFCKKVTFDVPTEEPFSI